MATLLRNLRLRLILWLYMLPFIARPKAVRHARRRLITFALTAAPIAGADGDDDGDDDDQGDDDDDAGSGDGDDDDQGDDDDDAAGGGGDDDAASQGRGRGRRRGQPDWKRESRKHERNYKKALKKLADLERDKKDRDDADQSTREKELEGAKAQAREELQKQHNAERRQDRLEVATTKLAAKGLKVGSGDDAKTLRFTDPDDALVHLERDIRSGELDADDIFDDNNRVRQDALEEALTDILERKPHLASDGKSGNGGRRAGGSADGGKGKGAPNAEDITVEKRLSQIRRHKAA